MYIIFITILSSLAQVATVAFPVTPSMPQRTRWHPTRSSHQRVRKENCPPLVMSLHSGKSVAVTIDEGERTSPSSSSSVVVTSSSTQQSSSILSSPSAEVVAATTTPQHSPYRYLMDEGIFNFNKILIDAVYRLICVLYPIRGTTRDFVRFYVLETVARVPYFAYLSVMHLKETFGERYNGMSERMRTHYAEADNELHHLLIMESLGGNSSIVDRTIAQTMAFVYYWYVVAVYAWNEPAAYHLSELIEDHAYNTYDEFLTKHEDSLRRQPVPDIARKYYEQDNLFLFDLFCTVKPRNSGVDDHNGNNNKNNEKAAVKESLLSTRRPKSLKTLYDVFVNIRDDEKEHWKTLCNLVQYNDMNAVDATQVGSTVPATRPVTIA